MRSATAYRRILVLYVGIIDRLFYLLFDHLFFGYLFFDRVCNSDELGNALIDRIGQRRRVKAERIATLFFRLVHCGIGIFQRG